MEHPCWCNIHNVQYVDVVNHAQHTVIVQRLALGLDFEFRSSGQFNQNMNVTRN